MRIGWLINPQECQVEIYRQGQAGSSVAYQFIREDAARFYAGAEGSF